MDGADVALLRDAGVAAVDVAGAGGTNWALVEGRRDPRAGAVAAAFADWGVPTADALREALAAAPGLPVLASGGVRDGVDAAKCLALGAVAVGLARPFLLAAQEDRAGEALGAVVDQLRIATWAAGAPSAARPRARAPRGDGMRAVVVGAGLGGLGVALRLQGQGYEVVVLEQRERPGGRASQLRDAGFTWDMGPSLVTMPWVLEETFAAGGLDLHREVDLVRLDPLLPDPLGRGARPLRLRAPSPSGCRREIAKFSAADAARVRRRSWPRCAPIYEDGILAAGPPAVPARARPGRLRAADGAPRRRAAAARARRAPLPPPARARGVLVPLALHRRRPVPRAGDLRRAGLPPGPRRRSGTPAAACTRSSRRWRARSTCAAARTVAAHRAHAAAA